MSNIGRGKISLSVCLALSISACGGGGGGGGGGIPLLPTTSMPDSSSNANSNPPSTDTPGDPPVSPLAITHYSYKLGDADLTSFGAFTKELESPTVTGLRPFMMLGITISPPDTLFATRAIYRRDGEKSDYVHRVVPATDSSNFSKIQALGAEGYQLTQVVPLSTDGAFSSIFSKDKSANIAYVFTDAGRLPLKDADKPAFLESLNKLGGEGFCNALIAIDTEGTEAGFRVRLMREQPTTARCSFALFPLAKSADEHMAQANTLGAEGRKFVMDVPGALAESLYVRDTAQKTVFKYHSVETELKDGPGSLYYLKTLVSLLNQEGAKGAIPTDYRVDGSRSYMTFSTAYDCTGILCR